MKTTLPESRGFTALSLLRYCLVPGLLAGCTASAPDASTLQRLQGTWEGFELSRETPTGPYVKSDPDHKILLTIHGSSLHFYKTEDFWWETTFTLPAGTNPQQLHATIERPEDSSGDVVIAFL